MNITLVNTWRVIDSKGGTEKVFCDMANELSRRGYDVTAICHDPKIGVPGFPLSTNTHSKNHPISTKNHLSKSGLCTLTKKNANEDETTFWPNGKPTICRER